MHIRNKNLNTQNNPPSLFGKRKKEKLAKNPKVKIHLETVQMPGDVMNIIAGYCLANSNEEKISFFNTRGAVCLSKLPGQFYVHKLLSHVVKGEEKEAEAMVRKNPELLFQSSTVIDYSFRTLLNVTPVTAAYGADDVEMLKMMFKYLDGASRDRASGQIKETFPEEKEPNVYDFSPIVAAITANKKVEATIEQFRQDFTPGTIEKGKHFNIKNLLAAYKAYTDNWLPWSYDQSFLFFCQVIGFLQRLLPACYAQAFCQGLYKVTESHKSLLRALKLDDGRFFYPESGNRNTGLGFDFGLYVEMQGSRAMCRMRHYNVVGGVQKGVLSGFEELYRTKTSALRDLMQCPNNRAKPACAIM